MKSPPVNHVHIYDKTKMLSDSQLQLLPQDLHRKLPFDTVDFYIVNTVVNYIASMSNITFSSKYGWLSQFKMKENDKTKKIMKGRKRKFQRDTEKMQGPSSLQS